MDNPATEQVFPEIITLDNVYDNIVELIRWENNVYLYSTDVEYEIVYSHHGRIEGIEVSGGPYIGIGDIVPGGCQIEEIDLNKQDQSCYITLV